MCKAGGMRHEVDSRDERLVILREEDVGGRERVTTDEERVARGAEQAVQISRLSSGKSLLYR